MNRPAMSPRLQELVLLLCLLGVTLSIWFFVIPLTIRQPPLPPTSVSLSADFVPRLVTGVMILVLIVRLARHGLAFLGGSGVQSDTEMALPTLNGLIIVLATLIFAFLLVPTIGFYAASAILMAGLLPLLGERRIIVIATVCIVFLLAVYATFDLLLGAPLPRGWLFAA